MKKLLLLLSVITLNLCAKTIPWIDMDKFINGTEEEKFQTAIEFGKAFETLGFVAVTNIGIDQDVVERAYSTAEDYFNLPIETKMMHCTGQGLSGYIPYGHEHAKNNPIPDLKEMYQNLGYSNPENLWPNNDLPQFKQDMYALYRQLQGCVKHCLKATAISLGYTGKQETILSDMLGDGKSLMRILHYPAIDPSTMPPRAIRAASHEDICMMTVIPRPTATGLQVRLHDGTWMDVVVPEGSAIINAGDTLSRITNYKIPSTTHRVVNPANHDGSERYSVPFFGQPSLDDMICVLDNCVLEGETAPEDVTFGKLLLERLSAIGIKK